MRREQRQSNQKRRCELEDTPRSFVRARFCCALVSPQQVPSGSYQLTYCVPSLAAAAAAVIAPVVMDRRSRKKSRSHFSVPTFCYLLAARARDRFARTIFLLQMLLMKSKRLLCCRSYRVGQLIWSRPIRRQQLVGLISSTNKTSTLLLLLVAGVKCAPAF